MGVLLAMLLHLHGYRLIVAGPRPGLLGVTDTGEQTVTLYEYDGEPQPLIRKVAAYETGHVLDVSCLTRDQRRRWRQLRHLNGEWYAPDLAPESGYGSGDFADVFSAWATHSPAYAQGRLPRARDLHTLAVRFHFARGICPRKSTTAGRRHPTGLSPAPGTALAGERPRPAAVNTHTPGRASP